MVIESITRMKNYVEVILTERSPKLIDNEVWYSPSVTYHLPLHLDNRQKIREELNKYPKAVLGYILSHEPIIKEQHRQAVASHKMTWKAIIEKQRLMDGDSPYIDDFGFYVYAYAELDFNGVASNDMRHELSNSSLCQTGYLYLDNAPKTSDMKLAGGKNSFVGP